MIKYYNFMKIQKVPTLSIQLFWSHYCELLSLNEINYYINLSVSQSLSTRQLREKIKSNEYERLDGKRVNK